MTTEHTAEFDYTPKAVVMFSGGLGSWITARRAAEIHGPENIALLFADVKGDHTLPHVGEDEDTYRFIVEAAADVLGVRLPPTFPKADWLSARHLIDAGYVPGLVRVADGRHIWEVFRDDRFLGNSRLANCSKFLKQKPCRDWLDAKRDPSDTTVYVGIDWSETHRLPEIRAAYAHPFGKSCGRTAPCTTQKPCTDAKPCRKHRPCDALDPCANRLDRPWAVAAPLTDPPYLDRAQMQQICADAGIELPRLYKAGFLHNNCGGFCVRAGQAQMENLHHKDPARYAFHEREEQRLREYLGKDVAVLNDRTQEGREAYRREDGTLPNRVPLTLRTFRERIEGDPTLFDQYDVGGCGCFVGEESA